MPFTFAHPALILPLRYLPKKWFSLTGLIIGSLIPDFEYFLRMKIKSNYSHTIGGLFWFDLPLALLIAFTFHHIVRNQLIANLPSLLKSRFIHYQTFNWNKHFRKNSFVVLYSILVGASSHLFWDSFTHHDGYFVSQMSYLKNVIKINNFHIPILKALQHSSTFFGAIVITYTIYKLPSKNMVQQPINFKYWSICTGLTCTIIAIRLLTGLDIKQYGNVIVTTISAFLISLILTPLLTKTIK